MRPGGYRADLAAIHDHGWTQVAEAGATTLVVDLRSRGLESGLVVELGCGSGASSRILTDAGYDVLGIDSSPAMIELARGRAPAAEFRVGSFVDAEIPPCVGVTAFGEVLNYLFDERVSTEALTAVFSRVFAGLRTRGVFLLDVAGPGRGTGQSWKAGEDWAVLASSVEGGSTLTRRIVTFRREGDGDGRDGDGGYRRDDETHTQMLLPAADVTGMLRGAGFSVRALRAYGNTPLAAHVRGFRASRAGRGLARPRA